MKNTKALDYGKLTAAELGKLWSRAARRGDEAEVARILRICPRVTGSLRDTVFVDLAARESPERVCEILGYVSAPIATFEVIVRKMPDSLAEHRLLAAVRSGDVDEAIRIVRDEKFDEKGRAVDRLTIAP